MKKKIAGYLAVVSLIALFTVFANYSGFESEDNEDFDPAVFNTGDVNILAFTSPYCSACKNQEKIVDKLQSEITDGAVFEYVDVTKHRKVAAHYDVAIVPTLVITRHGIEIDRFTGRQNEPEIKKVIEREIGRKYCFDGTMC